MIPEEQKMQEKKLLVVYGIATGLYAAEGQLAMDKFCAAAEELRKKPEENYWQAAKQIGGPTRPNTPEQTIKREQGLCSAPCCRSADG